MIQRVLTGLIVLCGLLFIGAAFLLQISKKAVYWPASDILIIIPMANVFSIPIGFHQLNSAQRNHNDLL